jgi:predicted RNA-binding protein with PUA domain
VITMAHERTSTLNKWQAGYWCEKCAQRDVEEECGGHGREDGKG